MVRVRGPGRGRCCQASTPVLPSCRCDRPVRQHFPELARSPCPPLQSRASGCFPLQTEPAIESFSSALHTVPAAKMSHHATHTLTRSTLHLKYPRAPDRTLLCVTCDRGIGGSAFGPLRRADCAVFGQGGQRASSFWAGMVGVVSDLDLPCAASQVALPLLQTDEPPF